MTGCGVMKETAGFSLIELLIVTVIVAILSTLALPAYVGFIRESRRSDATIALMELAAAAERHYATNSTFSGVTPATLLGRDFSEDGHYRLAVTVSEEGQRYTASATPLDEGSQMNDRCYRYLLDSVGQRGNESRSGAAISSSPCWPE
jgi:type IV pilus assembly protein PilE